MPRTKEILITYEMGAEYKRLVEVEGLHPERAGEQLGINAKSVRTLMRRAGWITRQESAYQVKYQPDTHSDTHFPGEAAR
jgi:hypothetical protein